MVIKISPLFEVVKCYIFQAPGHLVLGISRVIRFENFVTVLWSNLLRSFGIKNHHSTKVVPTYLFFIVAAFCFCVSLSC